MDKYILQRTTNDESLARFQFPRSSSSNAVNDTYYLKSRWFKEDHSFELLLSDTKNVWISNATSKYIENVLKPNGMSIDHFVSLLKSSLVQQDLTGELFTYRLRQSSSSSSKPGSSGKPSSIELTINIKLQKSDISVKTSLLFSRSDSQSSLQDYFEWLINKYDALGEHNRQLTLQNDTLQQQFNQSITVIERLTEEKHQLEIDLYNKFIVILNEKKNKIRDLINSANSNTNTSKISNSSSTSSSTPSSTTKNRSPLSTPSDKKRKSVDGKSSSHSNTTSLLSLNPMSLDLLGADDFNSGINGRIPNVVRKRYKPNNNNNTTTSTTTVTTIRTSPAPKKLLSTTTTNTGVSASNLFDELFDI